MLLVYSKKKFVNNTCVAVGNVKNEICSRCTTCFVPGVTCSVLVQDTQSVMLVNREGKKVKYDWTRKNPDVLVDNRVTEATKNVVVCVFVGLGC